MTTFSLLEASSAHPTLLESMETWDSGHPRQAAQRSFKKPAWKPKGYSQIVFNLWLS